MSGDQKLPSPRPRALLRQLLQLVGATLLSFFLEPLTKRWLQSGRSPEPEQQEASEGSAFEQWFQAQWDKGMRQKVLLSISIVVCAIAFLALELSLINVSEYLTWKKPAPRWVYPATWFITIASLGWLGVVVCIQASSANPENADDGKKADQKILSVLGEHSKLVGLVTLPVVFYVTLQTSVRQLGPIRGASAVDTTTMLNPLDVIGEAASIALVLAAAATVMFHAPKTRRVLISMRPKPRAIWSLSCCAALVATLAFAYWIKPSMHAPTRPGGTGHSQHFSAP